MEFGWIGVIVAVVAAIYCIMNHFQEEKLQEKDEEKRRSEAMLRSQLYEEQEKSELAQQAALRLAILSKIEHYASGAKALGDWTAERSRRPYLKACPKGWLDLFAGRGRL